MLKESLIQIYENDLRKVAREIEQYKSDEDLWVVRGGIANSGGNLALHLIGNIKHFFGANIGKSGYIRERSLEFSDKEVSREKIVGGIEEAIEILKSSLSSLSEGEFQEEYPEDLGGGKQKIGTVAIYMLSHLNYHLGQINYHRRLLSEA